jgi:hypothetical protein
MALLPHPRSGRGRLRPCWCWRRDSPMSPRASWIALVDATARHRRSRSIGPLTAVMWVADIVFLAIRPASSSMPSSVAPCGSMSLIVTCEWTPAQPGGSTVGADPRAWAGMARDDRGPGHGLLALAAENRSCARTQ